MTSRPASSSRKRPASASAAAAAASAPPPFEHDDELTEYERERLAKIAENKRIMMELGETFFDVFLSFSCFRRRRHSNLDDVFEKKPNLLSSSTPTPLDIHTHAAALAPEPKKKAHTGPSRRGVGAAERRRSASSFRPDPDAPRRSSLRIKGVEADGKFIVEETKGKLVTTEGAFDGAKGSGWRPQEGRAADDVVRARHPPGLVPFASLNQGDDARYLEMLREAMTGGFNDVEKREKHDDDDDDEDDAPILQKRRSSAGGGGGGRGRTTSSASSSFSSSLAAAAAAAPAAAVAALASPSTAAAFASSTLAERDVVKVVRDGCVHLAWHPGGGAAILASADKKGAVSLFDADWASKTSSAPASGDENASGAAPDEAGVLEFAPHHSYVCGLKWAAGGRLFTASYDGSVRVLDPSFGAPPPPGKSNLGAAGGDIDSKKTSGGGVFAPAVLHADAEWSAFDCSDDGRLGIVADKGGEALLFDPRAGAASAVSTAAAADAAIAAAAAATEAPSADDNNNNNEGSTAPSPRPASAPPPRPTSALPKCVVAAFSLHEKKINTLSIDCAGGGHLFAASASDGSVQVFDLRKIVGGNASSSSPASTKIKCDLGASPSSRARAAKPVLVGGHAQSCQGAFFSPDGSGRLVSTSRDNTVKIWSTKKDAETALTDPLVSIRHDNNTGRWITPFRAVFTPRGDGVVLGGMKRTVDVYCAADGRQLATLRSEHMTAIGSRVAMHAERPMLAAATASGRVNVFRNE